MSVPKEVEIKFHIHDMRALAGALKHAGFKRISRSSHEMNSLYDLPGQKLHKRVSCCVCGSMARAGC
jgi:adenylate cyclase class IV